MQTVLRVSNGGKPVDPTLPLFVQLRSIRAAIQSISKSGAGEINPEHHSIHASFPEHHPPDQLLHLLSTPPSHLQTDANLRRSVQNDPVRQKHDPEEHADRQTRYPRHQKIHQQRHENRNKLKINMRLLPWKTRRRTISPCLQLRPCLSQIMPLKLINLPHLQLRIRRSNMYPHPYPVAKAISKK